VATGAVDGVFVEVHNDPAKALSDGANALSLNLLGAFLDKVRSVYAAVRQ